MERIPFALVIFAIVGCSSSTESWHQPTLVDIAFRRTLPVVMTDDYAIDTTKVISNEPPRSLEPIATSKVIRRVNPFLPREFLEDRGSANVLIDALVDPPGNVVKAIVIKSDDVRLNRSVLTAVIQWKFAPQQAGGTLYWQPIPFRLSAQR